MRPFFFFCAALLLLSAPLAAKAGECRETAETQEELNLCADKEFQQAESALADVTLKLLAKVSPAGGAKFRASLDAWRLWRDAQCEFETFGSVDGSVHAMVLAECYERLTAEYAETLRVQLNCEEGDVSCGGQ